MCLGRGVKPEAAIAGISAGKAGGARVDGGGPQAPGRTTSLCYMPLIQVWKSSLEFMSPYGG